MRMLRSNTEFNISIGNLPIPNTISDSSEYYILSEESVESIYTSLGVVATLGVIVALIAGIYQGCRSLRGGDHTHEYDPIPGHVDNYEISAPRGQSYEFNGILYTEIP